MSDSIVFHLDRANILHIVDPDTLPHYDTINPLMNIAIEIINSGFSGVQIDELRLSNGRYMQSIDVNKATPEGRILNDLSLKFSSGCELPKPASVIALIRNAYKNKGKSNE